MDRFAMPSELYYLFTSMSALRGNKMKNGEALKIHLYVYGCDTVLTCISRNAFSVKLGRSAQNWLCMYIFQRNSMPKET